MKLCPSRSLVLHKTPQSYRLKSEVVLATCKCKTKLDDTLPDIYKLVIAVSASHFTELLLSQPVNKEAASSSVTSGTHREPTQTVHNPVPQPAVEQQNPVSPSYKLRYSMRHKTSFHTL